MKLEGAFLDRCIDICLFISYSTPSELFKRGYSTAEPSSSKIAPVIIRWEENIY